MTAEMTWNTLRAMWIDMYVSPPDTLITDAGTNFTSKEFVGNANSMAIEVEEVPAEAHQSIGKVERYHAMIRRGYEVISEHLRRSNVNNSLSEVLQMAVKAVNNTVDTVQDTVSYAYKRYGVG